MKLRLSWTKTGDYFDIVARHPELAEWYVSVSKEHDDRLTINHFDEDRRSLPVDQLIASINSNLKLVNDVFTKLKIQCIPAPDNLFDQAVINQLHKDWIHINQTYQKIDTLLYKLDQSAFDAFHAMNRQLHVLENSFKYHLRGVGAWRALNPFTDHIFEMEVCNVALSYCDHGRNSWEKFVNGDTNPNDNELSQWNNIGANIQINLVKPYVQSFPVEFLNYCADHNMKPVYDQIPLGNVTNLSELTKAREIMNKNFTQQQNYLIISL